MKNNKYAIHIEPEISCISKLADIVNRVYWWLPFENLDITIKTSESIQDIHISDLKTPEGQYRYLESRNCKIKLVSNCTDLNPDYVLCHEYKLLENIKDSFRSSLVLGIDKYKLYFKGEPSSWGKVSYETQKYNIKYFDKISKENFSCLEQKCISSERSYCFTSGPSIDNYEDYKFKKESLKIICNGILFNDKLLKDLDDVDVICIMDVYYFFSSSLYTNHFYTKLLEYLEKNNLFVVVPWYKIPLLLSHFPELKPNLIGIATSNENLNFPTSRDPYVKSEKFPNILRTFMIPLASSLTREIYILGADGYSNVESKKNDWKYSSLINDQDLKSTVKTVNPSIINERDSISIYTSHCELLETLIEYGEKKSKKYFSMNKSNIKCLRDRYLGNFL